MNEVVFTVIQRVGSTSRITVCGDLDMPPDGFVIIARVRRGQFFLETVYRTETLDAPPVAYISEVVRDDLPADKADEFADDYSDVVAE